MELPFSKLTKLSEEWGSTTLQILILGLHAVGKTTILSKLSESIFFFGTTGFNVEEVQIKGLSFSAWDVGDPIIRPLWRHYYRNCDGLIYVVDSADPDSLERAADKLRIVIDDECMPNVPLLVFANKQDLPTAMPTSKLVDGLQLHNFRHNEWYVQASNAVTGDGLYEGFEQLSRMVREARKNRA